MNTKIETVFPSSVSLEFVVGVTGHRDSVPEHADALKDSVGSALRQISGCFNHVPVRLVTGLAEGADMHATEVALEMGLRVSAVLPMPKDIYEADFTGEALTAFRKLLADPRIDVVELPLVHGRSASDMDLPANRDDQYDLLKNYLVRRSNVLLAMWDGTITELRGGTSDVVLSYLSGDEDAPSPSKIPIGKEAMDDCGEIAICINTPRQSVNDSGNPDGYVFLVSNSTGVTFCEMPSIPLYYLSRWASFDDYAALRYSDRGEDLDVYPLVGDNVSCLSNDTGAIEAEFFRADQLAMSNQILSDRLFKSFGLIAGAMGLFFLVYAKLAALKIYLVLYIALFAAGYIAYRISAKKHWLGRHLAYRALAETFRVQFFILLSGAGRSLNVRRVLNLTSVDRFKGFEWLQDAVRCTEPAIIASDREDERLETVRQHWIDDQAAYFSRKLHHMHTQHARLEIVKSLLFAGSIAGALALIFFKKTLLHMDMAGYDGKALLVFTMGLLPLWLAVWELYQGKMATRELIWQYSNQRRYFVAASQQILNAPDPAAKRLVISNLAEQALAEIYLWSVHRYHREHEPPAAG